MYATSKLKKVCLNVFLEFFLCVSLSDFAKITIFDNGLYLLLDFTTYVKYQIKKID